MTRRLREIIRTVPARHLAEDAFFAAALFLFIWRLPEALALVAVLLGQSP